MERNKYPRTYHLPYSQSKTYDDKTLPNDELLKKIKRRMKNKTKKSNMKKDFSCVNAVHG